MWSEREGEDMQGVSTWRTWHQSFWECVESHSVPQSLMWAQKRTVKGATFVSGILLLLPTPCLQPCPAPQSSCLSLVFLFKKSYPPLIIKAYWFYISFL